MPKASFFAAHNDQLAVIDYLLAETELRVFENYSEFSQPLREFHAASEVDAIFPLGNDARGNGGEVCLRLWSPSVTPISPIRRIDLNPDCCEGHTFRYTLDERGGIFILVFGGVCGNSLTISSFESTTKTWVRPHLINSIDWNALAQMARRVQYHISQKMAVAKAPGRPVLPEALKFAQSGLLLKDLANAPSAYNDQLNIG